MARPVVHFEVIGRNPDQLRRYYGDLFGWTFDAPSPVAPASERCRRTAAARASLSAEDKFMPCS